MSGEIFSHKVGIAIVGGGASGLMAAISAAKRLKKQGLNQNVVLLEGQSRVGKKLLATGNGRCNLTNQHLSKDRYHGDTEAAFSILSQYPPKKVIALFQSMGLLCRTEEEGRVYPYCGQASAVLDILRLQLSCLKIQEICDFQVERITKEKEGFLLYGKKGSLYAQRVILACGGKAAPQLGANESGMRMAKTWGHTILPAFPTLVPVRTEKERVKALKGIRSEAVVRMYLDNSLLGEERGEVQFTDQGVSGICVFQLSRFVGSHNPKGRLVLKLDLLPEYGVKQVGKILQAYAMRYPEQPVRELFTGLLNKRLGQEIVKQATDISGNTLVSELKERTFTAIAVKAKSFDFPIIGTMPWQNAQVMAGGIPLKEVKIDSLESKRCPGLYFAGEILNVDGDCGGFNLHWAWSSGITAGLACAESLKEENRA